MVKSQKQDDSSKPNSSLLKTQRTILIKKCNLQIFNIFATLAEV